MGTAVGGSHELGGSLWLCPVLASGVLAGQPCDGYLQADGHTLGPRDYEEHMYVNTQSLDTWEPEAHGAAEESPKKDLFDMSKPLHWGKWCRTCCGVVKLCQQLSGSPGTALEVLALAEPTAVPCSALGAVSWGLSTPQPSPASCPMCNTPQPLDPTGPFEDALKLHECIAGGGTSAPIEDQWPSPPTRKAPIAPTEEQLRREPWYHGKMSRWDAERLLQMDGDFLVRDSLTNPGQYVLTGMHSGQPKHLLLVDPEGVVRAGHGGEGRARVGDEGHRCGQAQGAAIGCCMRGNSPELRTTVPWPQVRTKDVLFESISHLISHHRQNEQPIVAAESELHLRQIVQRKQ